MSVEKSVRTFLVVTALVTGAAGAYAQDDATAPGTTAGAQGPTLTVDQGGLAVQSATGDYRVSFGLVLQADGRFSLDQHAPILDTFTLRKIRPIMAGRISRYFEYKLTPDFGGGIVVVQDAYFDVRFARSFRVRAGKDKTPIGYELLQTDVYLLFPERSLASSLVPNRDIGLQVQGDIGTRVSYAGGVFNGVPDAASSMTDVDTNGTKDVAGRVVVQPFRASEAQASAASGFGVQVGGSSGVQAGPLPSFKTSVNQTYFSYAAGAAASGARTRVAPAVFYYYKGLGTFAEYMRSTQIVSRLDTTRAVENQAWEVTASYVFTGESASDRGVRPQRPFDPAHGQWGALQGVARYASLRVDDAAFTADLAAPGSARVARQVTVGANWYPTSFIKYYATFERTTFENAIPPARAAEHIILVRAQLGF